MRRVLERAVASASLFSLLWLGESDARAQQCANPLISTCINSESFWPHAGPQRFAAVGSAETVAERQIAFGLVGSYLSRPIVIRGPSPGGPGSDQYAVDNQVNANFLFAYGVTDRLQLDLGLPITLVQDGAGTSPLTGGPPLRDTAVRDLRFGFAYALVPRARVDLEKAADEGGPGKAFAVVSRFTVSAPIGDNQAFAGERTAVFVPSVAADYRFSRLFFGAEVGARIRPTTEFAGARVGTQLMTALGAGVEILPESLLSGFVEGRAYANFAEQHTSQQSAFGITSRPNGEHIVPAEWTLGVRSAPFASGDLGFMAGGGGPLPITDGPITVPRFRFLLGISYAPMNRDSDGDGVPDRIDRCPGQPGERGGERPGCPRPSEPPTQAPTVQTPPPTPLPTPGEPPKEAPHP